MITQRKIGHPERDIQTRAVHWFRFAYPGIRTVMSPAGIKFGGNKIQRIVQAKIMKAMGYEPGTCDLFIMAARGGYHGLALEIKTEDGALSPDQKQWLQGAANAGYFSTACFGYDSVEKTIKDYMEQKS